MNTDAMVVCLNIIVVAVASVFVMGAVWFLFMLSLSMCGMKRNYSAEGRRLKHAELADESMAAQLDPLPPPAAGGHRVEYNGVPVNRGYPPVE